MKSFNQLVGHFSNASGRKALLGMQRGIEREALRVDAKGHLAMDPHPQALGSALTHPRITTDYSEALLEFITPVHTQIDELLEDLTQIHAYSVRCLNGQQLWPVSMPCYVGEVKDIPIAQYGTSNTGRLKTLYRKGLTYRYGAQMQIISGVHFNFSVSDQLWQSLYELGDKDLSLDAFISDAYFGLIRNYRRLVWVLPYLFGASPALCSSFVQGQNSEFNFEKTGKGTLYLPYATSLRMSDLGYTNKEQERLKISYNSLHDYLAGVKAALALPSGNFANIGVKVDGEYRQLNANVLQIENEFYSPIRAKRVTRPGEKPSEALKRAGVEYIEVRALDVNPFSAIGIETSQVRFLDLFLLYCLLEPSPHSTATEEREMMANLKAVVGEGRRPGLMLSKAGQSLALKDWLLALFAKLNSLAKLLDGDGLPEYQSALETWLEAVHNPERTLSGRVMQAILTDGHDHSLWVKTLASQYHSQLNNYPLSDRQLDYYRELAKRSLMEQAQLEAQTQESFDDFLGRYFGHRVE